MDPPRWDPGKVPTHDPLPLTNLNAVEDAAPGRPEEKASTTVVSTAQKSASGTAGVEAAEMAVVAALRAGDEDAFRTLVRRHHGALVRLAATMLESREVAEEVVQETWLAVIRGIDGFEGRSSLRTWIFRILMNQARRRRGRERRAAQVPLQADPDDGSPVVDAARFVPDDRRWAGHWSEPPAPWTDLPPERFSSKETVAVAASAINELPLRQREVVALRDIDGLTGQEVCRLLGLSEGNQRVLLHRGRSTVRSRLEMHLGGEQ